MVIWMERNEKLGYEEFREVEKLLGIHLPEDYIDWFQQYYAVVFKESDAYIFIDNELYHFDDFYEVDGIADEVEAGTRERRK